MRPTKNRYYCQACRRCKMLFATQDKADRFIRFNNGEMLEECGKAPVRSYYCQLCCGWHVTSNPSESEGAKLDERNRKQALDLERRMRINEEVKQLNKTLSGEVAARIEKAKCHIKNQHWEAARYCLNESVRVLDEALNRQPAWHKGAELRSRALGLLKSADEGRDSLIR